MAGITGIGTTFNLPNYHGELFALTPSDTPFLSAIGGLTGGRQTTSTGFEWQTFDLRAPAQPAILEGASAPTAQERVRANIENVCQIHQEQVSVSYTKQAASGQYATPGSAPFRTADGIPNPVADELGWQTVQALKSIALDVDFSLINGLQNIPTTNAAARRTKGLIQAAGYTKSYGAAVLDGSASTDTITVTHALNNGDKVVFTDTSTATNIVAGRVYFVVEKSTTTSLKVALTAGGAALALGTVASVKFFVPRASGVLSVAEIEDAVQNVYDGGGLSNGLGTLLVNSTQKRAITAAYATAYGKAMPYNGSRDIAGVSADLIITDFGTLNVIVDRNVPKDAIIITSLDQLAPVFLNVPGKGVFFEEPLAKTGAADAVQIYGEIGLMYGNPAATGVVRGLLL